MLAIDVGSSWCKAALINPAGQVIAYGTCYTRSIAPARDGALERFWDATVSASRAALAQAPDLVPGAISISCRGLFGVCLDSSGNAFWPAWNYSPRKTSSEVIAAYAADIWKDKDPYSCGYAVRLAALIMWLRENNPEEWNRIHRVGALHDYIVYRLTGRWVTDPTTGPEHDHWPEELLEISGLSAEAFPDIMQPEEFVALVHPDAASQLGLPGDVPVVTGFHDGAAANRGTGTIRAGDACLTLGTNFVLRAVTGERLTTGCFCYTVAPGRWAWVNNVPAAATQLDTVAEALAAPGETVTAAHKRLGSLADREPPGSDGARINLVTSSHIALLVSQIQTLRLAGFSVGAIYGATLEAVAAGMRGLICDATVDGARPVRYVATGGSSRNAAYLNVLSAMIDAPIEVGEPEAGMIGAAMAAAVGAGWYSTLYEAMTNMLRPGHVISPDAETARYYRTFATERLAES